MGITTIVTCDRCTRDIRGEDYAHIECKFEIDHNKVEAPDIREREFKIFCIPCGNDAWADVREVLNAENVG